MVHPAARRFGATVGLIFVLGVAAATKPAAVRPFRAFESFDKDDRAALEAGRPVVVVLPGRDKELGVFGAIRVDVGSERHVAWVRAIERFQRGRYVTAIGRFSNPPRLDDLASLTLPEPDLEALRTCSVGDCLVKLSEPEIVQIHRASSAAGARWKDALQDEFRRVMLARAQAYLAQGHDGTDPYHDGGSLVSLGDEFARLASGVELEAPYGSKVLDYLQRYPQDRDDKVESFIYWAQESLGGGSKPVISITHTAIFHGLGAKSTGTMVAAKQVFATHYFTGSLSLTLIDGRDGEPQYLLYERRARLDMLDGLFGGLVRRAVHKRLKAEAPAVLGELKRRLESGAPPS